MKSSLPLLPLPPSVQLESAPILKCLVQAHRRLAELKGAVTAIPNEEILIDTLSLREAKDSSTIENIITTEDELFQADAVGGTFQTPAAKEVHSYAAALKVGFRHVRKEGVIRLKHILEIQATLVENRAGLRKLPGTVLKNSNTGAVVYEPPQDSAEIERLMGNFVEHMNRDEAGDPDPLIRMAILHYQFESIHPFYDGNGRTGRILNLLHLVQHRLLDLPVLYLSSYIVRHKEAYYSGLQAIREKEDWEGWILFMLMAIEATALETLITVQHIKNLIAETKLRLRTELPGIYSQDLLNNLFRHPYTRIEFVARDLRVVRLTATKYLEAMAKAGIVEKLKIGRNSYYVNVPLFRLLSGPAA
ncbi:Fic family protein [Verrucomicrobium sp. GAS474]|uniref:Fic family protein n=1 Tax=Verrucomicrobium sp. GAS474 TaxID=1882831 RepID=UPI00087DC5F6|nr:Fic family protein [Verrucomicrobium sp. GAS474]SDU30556.1 Fic family protein [Verrucomicrobium sp. GAS474]